MSKPDFNDRAWRDGQEWATETGAPFAWFERRAKRRFDSDAPKGGGLVRVDEERRLTIELAHGLPAWDGESFAQVKVLRRGPDHRWRQHDVAELIRGPHDLGIAALQLPFELADGEWIGVVFRGTASNVRTDVAAVQYTAPPEPDPAPEPEPAPSPGGPRGAPWPCFADGRAPVLAMTPTGEQSADVWNEWWINAYGDLVAMGVDGTHTPLAGRLFPAFRDLYRANSNHGLVTACWCVFEGEGGRAEALVVVRELIALYDARPDPGWLMIGPTWDVWQAGGWEETEAVNRWIADVQALVGNRRILVGARARRDPATGRAEQRYDGDFRSYEAHVQTGAHADAVFAGAIREARGKPVGEFDRFRVRSGGEGKDMTDADMPLVCRAARDRRVAIIIGHDSDRGARPFALADQIRSVLVGADEPAPPPPDPDDGNDTEDPEIEDPADPETPDPPDDEERPSETPDLWEKIMSLIDAPIVDAALELFKEFLEDRQSERQERQSQREFTLALIDKTNDQGRAGRLIDLYISQQETQLERDKMVTENWAWWHQRFRALGNVFDGDAWERIVELFDQFGVKLPEEPPAPAPES